MNNEIKEILDRLFVYRNENDEMKYQPEDILTIEDVWLLLDYITNLQTIEQQYSAILSENAELENKINNLQDKEKLEKIFKKYYEDEVEKTNKLQDRNIELVLERDKYKSRNEKAIEYIEKNTIDTTFYIDFDGEINYVLYLLKGDNK